MVTMTKVQRSQKTIALDDATSLKAGDLISLGESKEQIRVIDSGQRFIRVERGKLGAMAHPRETPVRVVIPSP